MMEQSWTAGGTIKYCKTIGLAGAGIQTAALAFGGNPPPSITAANRRI
jgi:hypothetical protein